MQDYTTISVKISKEEREEMRKLNIKPSKIVRVAIKNKLKEERIRKLKTMRDKMDIIFEKLSTEDIIVGIREDRDSR